MEHMSDIAPTGKAGRPVRDTADAYVDQLVALNPIVATSLGRPAGQDRLPDFSPAGEEAEQELRTATLASTRGRRGRPASPPARTSAVVPGCCASGWKPSKG